MGWKEFWNHVKDLVLNFLDGYGKSVALAVVVLALGLVVVAIIKRSVKKFSTKSRKIDNSATAFITSVVSLIAYVALILCIIGALGFSTANIIAALSSVMLAIALGLQNTLASLANGILLIFTKPFKAGDFVDIGGTSGTVKEIKLFSVKIVTPDNLTIVIPNNTVFNATITNYSKMPLRRLDIVLPMSYDIEVDKVKKLVNEFVEKDERIVKNPTHFFRLTEYGASSLNFTLRVWTAPADFWNVKFDLLEGLFTMLRENGLEIPFDQLDVHVIAPKDDKNGEEE